MNDSASLTARLAGTPACGSPGTVLGSEPGGQGGGHVLGRAELLLGSLQRCAKIGKLCVQGPVIALTAVAAHIGAARGPDLHEALGSENPDGGLGCVQRYPVGVPKLSVRRDTTTGRAGPAADAGPENLGQPMAGETVQRLRHTTTITSRLKTDTDCRQRVGADSGTSDANPARAAAEMAGLTSPWPVRRCPSCGMVLDGGPVVFWCAGCGRSVQAADVDVAFRPTGWAGRAV